jgi:membrane associated rhomboid family serine protease
MREPSEPITSALPRPGRALKALLATIAVFAIVGEIVQAWGPKIVFESLVKWLAFVPAEVITRPWSLLTSAVLTVSFSHALWSLVGLYFLTPDLERRWGPWRLVRFLALSVVVGNLFVLALSKLPFGPAVFHPEGVVGPTAMIGATSIAWAKENRLAQIRFFFFFPMTGRTLYWATLGLATASIVLQWAPPEGVIAPLGGAIAGVLFSGSPSPVRSLWLRVKLGLLRRKGDRIKADAPSSSDRPRTKRGGKAPPLRIVYGGLEEDLKNRKPPKDKRYLN